VPHLWWLASYKNMKTVVIPDIHNKVRRAQAIIELEKPDEVILSGDLYDCVGSDCPDGPEEATATALWMKGLSFDTRIKRCLGNHDVYFGWNHNPYAFCSRWSEAKQRAVDKILTKEDWDKSLFFVFTQGWLICHAGLHPRHVPNTVHTAKELEEWLTIEQTKAFTALREEESHWMFKAGLARGGDGIGGLTWCDFDDEFKPFWQKQIVGHTPQLSTFLVRQKDKISHTPRWQENSVCIDTILQHYGVIENGNLEIKRVPESLILIK
jgi:hypothetical protein